MLYKHAITNTIYSEGAIVDGVQTHSHMSLEAWASLNCFPYIPEETPPVPPAPIIKHYSKLKLIRALYASNLGDLFANLLASSSQLAMEWQAAQDLAEDDPSFLQALDYLKTQANVTQEVIDTLLAQCEVQIWP